MAKARSETKTAGDVLKSPVRVRILLWLAAEGEARTKREIGRALSLSNAAVHYHMKLLEKAGLVWLEGTRPGPNGITEKLYRGKKREGTPDAGALDDYEKSELYLRYTVDSISEMHREAVELIKSDWKKNRFLVGCWVAHATSEEMKALKNRLTEVLREFYEKHQKPGKNTGPMAVTFGIVPSSGHGWATSPKVFDTLV